MPNPSYLVKRGYVQLTVDARGTGSSEGLRLEGLSTQRENKDGARDHELGALPSERPWSNGHYPA